MARTTLKFRLHRTVIVLICLTLLVVLMQGASWFSISHQMTRSAQMEELARTLTRQVAFSLTPLMANSDDNRQKIEDILAQLTHDSRILDATVYDDSGALVAHRGETIGVRDRLALEGQRAGSYFNQQMVQPLDSPDGPRGFLRITLDTHVLVTESRQVDNTTNILRLMMLLALAIGIILSRTLLRNRRSRWQQSPFLLTANRPVQEDSAENSDTPAKP
ncbi:YtjB family periplasmic protein [Erwinia psidii]|uniref:YtjB family periplasmic protein n=1 Tax=Erwinia psidii TaxID=69224 RepID=A0A3N6S2A2_9GAMM|nr:YtjB family periplasmic protein [Erwinia psidii]MCX8957484.1 YtjB family periplasmic protein [Erwinia psidii]MCX8960537.1 YtjB family periplasmic protein [Erwinia psidii]MCX8964218.1 YtjB family periplasmic protein [Erwinia psidii]RQM39694.1 YtjB family periplasmic protein [Erwinia psidii]